MSESGHGSRELALEALISPRVKVEDVVEESEKKIEHAAKTAEAVQQLTLEQLNRFQQQQEALESRTAEYLQQQYDNQVELNARQAALKEPLEQQQKALTEQYQLMRQAAETVGHQGRQIEDLKEELLSPRRQSRWGWFARSSTNQDPDGDDTMTGRDGRE
ncbi:hypothetical protein ON010_g6494 [Phytophthora cinnamomi]|nr:hypothetical protein ON010_g6494 [Phytophthora cinnamomi]